MLLFVCSCVRSLLFVMCYVLFVVVWRGMFVIVVVCCLVFVVCCVCLLFFFVFSWFR